MSRKNTAGRDQVDMGVPSGSAEISLEFHVMLPPIEDLEHYCIFLDFDGTLMEIEDHPNDVPSRRLDIAIC